MFKWICRTAICYVVASYVWDITGKGFDRIFGGQDE